jgi:hypothetical protein
LLLLGFAATTCPFNQVLVIAVLALTLSAAIELLSRLANVPRSIVFGLVLFGLLATWSFVFVWCFGGAFNLGR